MKKSLLGFLMILGVFVISCSDDDIKSSENEIKEFALEEQVGNAKISGNEITVTVSEDADLTSLAATTIKVSNFATVFPGVGVTQDFTSSVEYLVTAEDGSINIYVVSVALREIEDKDEEDGKTPSPQVLNSSFDNWYEGKSGTFTYPEIGEDEDDKTWGTGNAGAAFAINIGSDAGYPSEQFIGSVHFSVSGHISNYIILWLFYFHFFLFKQKLNCSFRLLKFNRQGRRRMSRLYTLE